MPTAYQTKDQTTPHCLTFQVVYWIVLFTRYGCRDIMIESLKYWQGERGERRIIANYPEFRAVPDVRYALSTAPLSKL
jgi:hypothetical protein